MDERRQVSPEHDLSLADISVRQKSKTQRTGPKSGEHQVA